MKRVLTVIMVAIFVIMAAMGTAHASFPCDFAQGDCDVDGSDLATLIAHPGLIDITTFAQYFGKASSAPFAQSDLQGTWNFMTFINGPDVTAGTYPGWIRGNITINESGSITYNSSASNLGSDDPPTTSVLTLNPCTGEITQTEYGQPVVIHGRLASNKNVLVGVKTANSGKEYAMVIAVKQNVTTFSSADVSSLGFVTHQIYSGTSNAWEHDVGSTNSAGQVTLSSCTMSSGSCTPPSPNFTTLSVTSTGIVSSSTDGPTFQGVMTPDKKMIFVTNGDGTTGPTGLLVLQVTGQTFTQSDLAGTWDEYEIDSSATEPAWCYGTADVDSADVMTWSFFQCRYGNTTLPSPATVSIDSGGTITAASVPSLYGAMSYNKDMEIITLNGQQGRNSLMIYLK
jgi:hypothetical protein